VFPRPHRASVNLYIENFLSSPIATCHVTTGKRLLQRYSPTAWGKASKASLPPVPLTWRHDVRCNRSPVFCCSHNRPPDCGLFPCARHHPRQHRTAVMFAADPAPVRHPASGLVLLKNAAWLSFAVREPTNIFQRGNDMATPTQNQQPLSGPATSMPPSGRTPERKQLSSPSRFHAPTRTLRATGRFHLPTA